MTVNVTVAEDDNYNALAATTITVTISDKQTQTVTASDVTAAYGDTGAKIEASITTGDGTLSYAVKSGDAVTVDESGNLTILKAGSAVITVTAAETDTYAQATKDVTVTISRKTLTITADSDSKAYDGTPLSRDSYTHTALVSGDSIESVTGTAVVKDAAGSDLTEQFTVKTVNGSLTIRKTEISGAIVSMDVFAYGEAVPTPGIVSNGREGSNVAVVGSDPTKQVTYYYQATAFLKSQTEDISTLGTAEGVYQTITPTTFDVGTYYVLAVITGDNYSNVPLYHAERV